MNTSGPLTELVTAWRTSRISDIFCYIILGEGLLISTLTHNLPAQLLPIVGREKELGDLISLLRNPDVGLITLHGLGGTGKTRLAIETGSAVLDLFPDGIWFVALAPLSSPDHIITATATAVGFSFHGSDHQKTQLLRFLNDKKLLLIFDNLEHLLPEGATYLEELLQNATEAKLLVTSRQPLNVVWEWVYPLHGLEYESPTPVDGEIPAALQLFLQHLRRMGSPPADNDLVCAAQVCQIVRGLPLALLLAASWGRTLGCEGIVQEIQRGISFFRTQQKTFPEKHSSMQAVFDYSWRLLSDPEQAALRKFAVFHGSFDRSAAAEVAGAQLPLLAHLVDQALVERVSKDRYQIHELLRQYLEERLVEAGEETLARDRHVTYYTRLAEQAEPGLMSKDQKAWTEKLQTEIDNVRAVLDWSLRSGEVANIEKGIQLMASSERFWLLHTYIREGYDYLLQLLGARKDEKITASSTFNKAYARGLNLAAVLAFSLEDLEGTRQCTAQALTIGLLLNDHRLIGDAYQWQGIEAFHRGEDAIAHPLFEYALENYRQSQYLPGITRAISLLGRFDLFNGDFAGAFTKLSTALDLARKQEDIRTIYTTLRSLGQLGTMDPRIGFHQTRHYFAEGLEYARELDDKRVIALILSDMGELARSKGELEQAAALFEESDSIASEIGAKEARIMSQASLGFVYLRMGKHNESQQLFMDILVNTQFAEHQQVELSFCLLGLAGLAIGNGRAQLAARILGAVEVCKKPIFLSPTDRNDYERILSAIKAQLAEKQFNQLYKEGQALTLMDAAQLIQSQGIKETGQDDERLNQLTKREIEILRLVAQGLSDAQVAERLVLSPRTINAHLTSTYNKLGVNSRVAATRLALEKGLV